MRITFYVGSSSEEWSPKTINSGIGGSEEAVIYLTKELVKLGHSVKVFNSCGSDGGIYDGVMYKNYQDYKEEPTDILVFWRNPLNKKDKILRAKNLAKKVYIWLHDTTPEEDLLPFVYFVDKFIVLSSYHHTLYRNIPQDKFYVSQNGVNLGDFNQKVERNPKKIIWTSSYDRGLKELLELWTSVKLAEPEAQLHIYYGWESMIKQVGDTNDYKTFRMIMDQLIDQEGVFEHGRVGHKELAKAILSAGVWAYPTWWPEISCISAMKAQIGGAIPVVIPTAAVAETVRWGLTTNWSYDHFQDKKLPEKVLDKFSELLVRALDPEFQEKYRDMMIEDAKKRYGWKKVAKQWDEEFRKAVK